MALCFDADAFGEKDTPQPIDCPWAASQACAGTLNVPQSGRSAADGACAEFAGDSPVSLKAVAPPAGAKAAAAGGAGAAAQGAAAGGAWAAMVQEAVQKDGKAAAAPKPASKPAAAAAAKPQPNPESWMVQAAVAADKQPAAQQPAAQQAQPAQPTAEAQPQEQVAAAEAGSSVAATNAAATNAAQTAGAPAPASSEGGGSTTSTGAMVGALLGGIAAGVAVGGALLWGGYTWVVRRHRAVAAAAPKEADAEKGLGGAGAGSSNNSASSWSDGESPAKGKLSPGKLGSSGRASPDHRGSAGSLESSSPVGSFTAPASPCLPRRSDSISSLSRQGGGSPPGGAGLRRTVSELPSGGASGSGGLRRSTSDGQSQAHGLRSHALPLGGGAGAVSNPLWAPPPAPRSVSSRSLGGGWSATENPLARQDSSAGSDWEAERSAPSVSSLTSGGGLPRSGSSSSLPRGAALQRTASGGKFLQRQPSRGKYVPPPQKALKYVQPVAAPKPAAPAPATKELARQPSKLDRLNSQKQLPAVNE